MNKVNLMHDVEAKTDDNLFINTISIIPQKSHSGFDLHFEEEGNNLLIWYRPPNRGKTFYSLSKNIQLNESFFEGLGLSIGDGITGQSKSNTHYAFGNTNLKLVENISQWLKNYFGIKRDNLFVFVTSRKNDSKFLQKVKHIFMNNNVRSYLSERNRKPLTSIQLSNSIFVALHNNLLQKLHKIILNSKEFRAAFLRGLFAAEGHVKHSKYGTIESLTISYNPKKEKFLSNFVIQCLKKDGIRAWDNNKGTIYICSYSNMLILYKCGLFSLHQDKQEKFEKLCRNAIISIHLKKELFRGISKFSQHKLAKKIGCSQASISNWVLGKKAITMQYFVTLFPFLNIQMSGLIDKIDFIKVSNSVVSDKNSIEFLLSLQKLKEQI